MSLIRPTQIGAFLKPYAQVLQALQNLKSPIPFQNTRRSPVFNFIDRRTDLGTVTWHLLVSLELPSCFTDTWNFDPNDVAAAREHIEAMLGLELYSHHLYMNIKHGNGHGE